MIMSEIIADDAACIEGLEACFFDDDFVQGELLRGKESTAGRWTHAEHEMFVRGLELHNKQWKLIAELIKTRTVVQVRTHAQKYFQKLVKQAKNDGTSISEDAYTDLFHDPSIDLLAGLKRKNSSNSLSVKNKVKRTESNSSLSNVVCPARSSSENDLRARVDIEKKRKLRLDGSQSPSHVSVSDSETEPFLNSYPIQVANGNNYPQINVITGANNSADWFNLPGSVQQPQIQRYQQMQPINNNYSMPPTYGYHEPNNYNADPSNYTHGICSNVITANYYHSRSYPPQQLLGQINPQNENAQQMDFPDPFGIGAGDFNAIDRGDFSDLIWYDIDDDVTDNTSTNENGRLTSTHGSQVSFGKESGNNSQEEYQQQAVQQHSQQPQTPTAKASTSKASWSDSVRNSDTSSAFGSSEAYTSYEESSLTSCTSSDDGCYEDYDGSSSNDQTIGDAMAVITNSQKRRLSKSSLALNKRSIAMYAPDVQANNNETEDKNLENNWLFKEYDEDLVSGIVEAFS